MLGKASVFSLQKLGSPQNNFVRDLIPEMESNSDILTRTRWNERELEAM